MSAVAIFQLHCCNRLIIYGRFEGKSDSTSGFYPKAWCVKCDPTKEKLPRREEKIATITFVGYTFDDRLEIPFEAIDKKTRYLTPREVYLFIRHDLVPRQRLKQYPVPKDQEPKP